MNTEVTKERIEEILKTVIDPEIGINIVDLGLIYDIEIGEQTINITMTLTTQGCPMHSSIADWVKRAIERNIENYQVNVNIVWDPQWTPERMSLEAKIKLGLRGYV